MSAIVLIVTFAAGFFLVFGMNLLLSDIVSEHRREQRQPVRRRL